MMPFLQLTLIHARFAPKTIPRGISGTGKKTSLPQMRPECASLQSTMVQRLPRRLDEELSYQDRRSKL